MYTLANKHITYALQLKDIKNRFLSIKNRFLSVKNYASKLINYYSSYFRCGPCLSISISLRKATWYFTVNYW